MKKSLVKVVGTLITTEVGGKFETTTARGIVALPKSKTLLEFIKDFLIQRQVTSFTLNQRSVDHWATSPMMYLTSEPKRIMTFNFSQFDIADLGYFIKDLSKLEQARDLKPLQKFLGSQSA